MHELTNEQKIKLTEFSHGAGCGCKISPGVLEIILSNNRSFSGDKNLLVGNESSDDAAVYQIDENTAIISTTDFFMPIVDDPYDFGRIAATNAISDVYAMGGMPMMAIAILGWPIDKLDAKIASRVIEGGRQTCKEAGISLAGGHSIDSPEPIFGLAVSGKVHPNNIKKNSTAKEGDLLFLTKKLGIGILSTAIKKGLIKDDDLKIAIDSMTQLNFIGGELGQNRNVTAMTDVTGFGLLGHLVEMCTSSGLTAKIKFDDVPVINNISHYLNSGSIPGGTHRNFKSYGQNITELNDNQLKILADPQTSGGLLVSVKPEGIDEIKSLFRRHHLGSFAVNPIGVMAPKGSKIVEVY